ncbi:hypothetical protein GWK90_03435 [Candidatus Hamiltonella defensa]|uniref:Uncharacterized protein n=2 Tax=Candidatus Williamhamiltonella defendens TaxID=138072 RepID=A0A4V0NNP6_9ENTR|nr:hypothetical protein [Candidatus Hamiltonella defensa]ASV33450.1 hypothetical protein CJJ18_04635 [Candidatus Hamiltonella defensa]AWK16396.1 hypothetical protein CCS40_04480 [Candidatus Hamiltonella defensa]AYB48395.1 hypothetical protein CJJ19_01435 [Candidatus Hamiltonella defensa]MBK4361347.1 hypothetical protein [Candidatus Hamiltonella defensa]
MDKSGAKKLLDDYMEGFKKNNLEQFLSALDEECHIIQPDGISLKGKNKIKEWFELFWKENRVNKLNVYSFYYLDLGEKISFSEWDLTYSKTHEQKSSINEAISIPKAISIVTYNDENITSIVEYQRTEQPHV